MSAVGNNYYKEREFVGRLICSVLANRISVREALLGFPKDCGDKTVKAAWYALCHLEADEDLRKKDELYRQEQDEYIDFIAKTLSEGKELPENIVSVYEQYHNEPLIPHKTTWEGKIKKLLKFLNI
ncbi:hypothetical protein IKQ26_08590 [bacterium]|nr:hypothetical protein [bacterium]